MCLNETYSKIRAGKLFSETFPIQNGMKQADAVSPLLLHLVYIQLSLKSKKMKSVWN
jgi:hypothetical protein